MYIVKYSGPFGFIKPWTAVRDTETFSQQFLTPSIVEGMEKKLFPEMLEKRGIHKIKRHRLTYVGLSRQQEVTQPKGIKIQDKKNQKAKTRTIKFERTRSIVDRMVMVNPTLYLAFDCLEEAEIASSQHLCLCRNEDVLLPHHNILERNTEEFDSPEGEFQGFELIFGETEDSFIVGANRFDDANFMHGHLKIIGNNPLKSPYEIEYDSYE
jgi:hypothetical protein